jgi:hypothetical protein
MGWLYYKLQVRHEKLQEARVEDAKKVTGVLLEMANDHNETTATLSRTLQDNTTALVNMKEAVDRPRR